MKTLRSLLSTPGNRADLVDKAVASAADALIIDFEDSVPPDEKGLARDLTVDLVRSNRWSRPLYVRVNSGDSEFFQDDIEAITLPGIDGIQLPKANAAADVLYVDTAIESLERGRGIEIGAIEMIVSIETATALVHAFEILSCTPRVGSVLVGSARNGDLQRSLGCSYSDDEWTFDHARATVLTAARAAGITNPIDGVYVGIGDEQGFRSSTSRAKAHGYKGRKVIHPEQIAWANEIFTPSCDELDFHRRVLTALAQAEQSGSGACVVDGMMVDIAMAESARQILRLVEEDVDEGG